MFAARDQENVVHTRPTSKPFSQGGNPSGADNGGLQKTPFRPMKAKFAGFKDAATPAVSNRLPLGLKTTNAKANSFQTPLPGKQRFQTAKGSSPRLRRPKIQVLQADGDVRMAAPDAEDDEREIEYMAPNNVLRATLPDTPYDEFGPGKTYPQFESQNMTRGWASLYGRSSHLPLKRDLDEENDDDAANRSVQEALDRLTAVKKRLRSHPQTRSISKGTARLPSDSDSQFARLTKPTVSSAARATPITTIARNRSTSRSRFGAVDSRTVFSQGTNTASPSTSNFQIPNIRTRSTDNVIHPSSIHDAPFSTSHASTLKSTIGYSRGRATSAQLRMRDISASKVPVSRPPISGLNSRSRPLILSSLTRSGSTPTPSYDLKRQLSSSKLQSRSNSRVTPPGTHLASRSSSVMSSDGAQSSNEPLNHSNSPHLGDDDSAMDTDDDDDQSEENALAQLLARNVLLEQQDDEVVSTPLPWLDDDMEEFEFSLPSL